MKSSEGSSLVISGSNDYRVQMVINKINFILGNYGETINHKETLNLFQGNDTEVEELTNDLIKGNVDALIVYDCNPVYSLPNGA